MTPGVINIGLTVPFLVLLAIFSIIFLRAGYKNGLWRSLVSLVATLVALVVSLLLGKLFGGIFGETAFKFLSRAAGIGADSGLAASVLQAALQVLMTLVFFGLFLLISVPVLKALAKRLRWSKLSQEPGSDQRSRFAGLGIRALDAILVTILLLMPIYGSLASLVPAANRLISMSAGPNDPAVQLLTIVEGHPMVSLYRSAPVAAVYRGISGFEIGDASFDVVQITDTMDGVISRIEAIDSAEGEERIAAASDLMGYLQENVIEEEWAYQMLQELLRELETSPEPMDQQMYALLSMSQEQFQDNGTAILEFLEYALNNNFVEFTRSGDYSLLPPDFYQRVGDLINHSDKAVALKKLIMTESASLLFLDYDTYNDELAMAQAYSFVERYVPSRPTEPALRAQEGEMFLRMYDSGREGDILAAFALHPKIGYAGVKELLTWDFLENSFYYDVSASRNASAMAALQSKLSAFAENTDQGYSFQMYAEAVCLLDQVLRGGEGFGFEATDAMLEELLQKLDDTFFQSNVWDGTRVKALLEQALEEARQTPGRTGWINLYAAYMGEQTTVFEPNPVYYYAGDGGISSTDSSLESYLEAEDGSLESYFIVTEDGEIIYPEG